MDRRLKERLVGATILVVLIILVVPELLSGPKRSAAPAPAAGGPAEPVRSVTVDLATRRATSAEDPAASAPASSPNAAPTPADADQRGVQPAAPTADADRTAGRPTIATLKAQKPADASLEKSPPAPNVPPVTPKPVPVHGSSASAGPEHGWAVQIGSFASRANAEKAMRHLKSLDESAYLSSSGARSSLRYRVRIGPYADRGAAEKAMARLKKDGESARLVPQ